MRKTVIEVNVIPHSEQRRSLVIADIAGYNGVWSKTYPANNLGSGSYSLGHRILKSRRAGYANANVEHNDLFQRAILRAESVRHVAGLCIGIYLDESRRKHCDVISAGKGKAFYTSTKTRRAFDVAGVLETVETALMRIIRRASKAAIENARMRITRGTKLNCEHRPLQHTATCAPVVAKLFRSSWNSIIRMETEQNIGAKSMGIFIP